VNVYCQTCGLRSDAHVPVCPIDGAPMRANSTEIPAAPPGFDQFDHTFTPDQAARIVAAVPDDSHHWRDIPRKAPNAVAQYTALMAEGRWRDETLELGFYEHPIRWDEHCRLTHGIMRLIACRDSGHPFRAAVFAPTGFLPGFLCD